MNICIYTYVSNLLYKKVSLVCMCACMCLHAWIYAYTHMYRICCIRRSAWFVCVCVYELICSCVCMCACACLSLWVRASVYYIWVCTHTYTDLYECVYTLNRIDWFIWYGAATISRPFSLAEFSPFYTALFQKRPIILRSLLIVATPCDISALVRLVCMCILYVFLCACACVWVCSHSWLIYLVWCKYTGLDACVCVCMCVCVRVYIYVLCETWERERATETMSACAYMYTCIHIRELTFVNVHKFCTDFVDFFC